jgi:hypothetical protein
MLAVIFFLISSMGFAQATTLHYFPTNPGASVQSAKWSIANSGANFTITNQVGTVVTTAKSAATTQSLTIFALPAKAMVLSCIVKSTTAFTGMQATLTATLGVTGTLTACVSTPFDLMAAVANTNFSVALPTVPIVSYAGTNLILALTSTVANISTITAGAVDVTITWQVLP